MKRLGVLLPMALALGATILAPGADAQPTAITTCQTISHPGSYEVVNNLFNPNFGTTCLVITTGDVTVNLAGFSITADPRRGVGIRAVAPSSGKLQGIAVRNGSSTVDLSPADLSIVEGVRAVCNFPLFPIGTGITASGIVKGNTVGICDTGIAGTGIVTGNYVIGSRGTDYVIGQGSTVIGNTAVGAAGSGVGIVVSCPSNVTDNTSVNHPRLNLVLDGNGCNNTNNVAP
jgi:hypothetical protein